MSFDTFSRTPERLADAWDALRGQVAARFRQLNEEIRHYPRPIARCDEQLTRLIEERDHARALLERMAASEASGSPVTQLHDILGQALRDDEIAAGMDPGLKALASER